MGQAVRFAPVAAGTVKVGNTHQTRDCLRYPREEIDDDSAAGRHRIGGTSTCYLVVVRGPVAQLGERRLCKADVAGSSPVGSTFS